MRNLSVGKTWEFSARRKRSATRISLEVAGQSRRWIRSTGMSQGSPGAKTAAGICNRHSVREKRASMYVRYVRKHAMQWPLAGGGSAASPSHL